MKDNYTFEGYIQLKSNKIWITLCQLIKSYSGLTLLIIIFFLLSKIFKSLKKKIEFNILLVRNVKFIGILLVIKSLTEVLLNYIIGSQFDIIKISSYNGDYFSEQNKIIHMNPALDFEFTTFVIGLSFLVLSYLLKHGYKLSQENELTI